MFSVLLMACLVASHHQAQQGGPSFLSALPCASAHPAISLSAVPSHAHLTFPRFRKPHRSSQQYTKMRLTISPMETRGMSMAFSANKGFSRRRGKEKRAPTCVAPLRCANISKPRPGPGHCAKRFLFA